MAGILAAQTAFGPMVQAAIEQYEPPERRLVSDDLALSILPAAVTSATQMSGEVSQSIVFSE